jgi:hypothetical protein
MDILKKRIREDAIHRAFEAAQESPRRPTELQEKVAYDLDRLLGEDLVVPRDVVEEGYTHPYYVCTYSINGLKFIGHYLWGGRDRGHYRTSSPWTVERRLPRLFVGDRVETREVNRLADLQDWV